jgi:hypothetical protein
MQPTPEEGVIKFKLEHCAADPLPPTDLAALRAWHRICHRLGLLGREPGRYAGFAYGNLSRRAASGFIISGTQTAGNPDLGPGDYAEVHGWDVDANRVISRGPCRPSSESITHGMIYEAAPANFIVHAHSPEIWSSAGPLGLAATGAEVAYGTPEMALAVRRLFETGELAPEQGLFVMLGHEDGVVSYGTGAETAGALMVTALARALQLADN